MHPAVERAHRQLIDRLIARGALWSRPLIDAFRSTPRHFFLDRVFARESGLDSWQEVPTVPLRRLSLRLAYSDRALATRLSPPQLGRPQVPLSSSSQPSLMAQMLEDLRLSPGMRTLEIGAGTGYNAALLAYAAGPVVSLDVDERVVDEARRHLGRFPERQVEVVRGDGRTGWQSAAPYERILVTAASPDLEPAWIEQSTTGGMIEVPLALAPGLAYLARGTITDGVFEGGLTRPAYFIALRSEDEGADEGETGAGLPEPAALAEVPAPWRDWTPRRAPPGGLSFIRSLAFLGWLEGLTIGYRARAESTVYFGVGDRGQICWMGHDTWRVDGDAGRDLGERLWRLFLEAGGPCPTEFRLRASATGVPTATAAGTLLTFRRRGLNTDQVWELDRIRPRPVIE
jgi:protein-L-isoaspartate(D-aspartate) O-methyltransferase